MERIPIRALNQGTPGLLARVADGGVIEMTNREATVARIVSAATSELDDLLARGRAVAASVSGTIPDPPGEPDGFDSAQTISELREDRL